MRVNKPVLLLSHFNYTQAGPIHGPLHTLTSYLQRKKISYEVLAYPLYAGTKSINEVYTGNKLKVKKFGTGIKLPLLLKSLIEMSYSLKKIFEEKPELIIAIDPLNALAAVIAKKVGLVKKVVFYTVDYTPERFQMQLLNRIYHWIDRTCLRGSNVVWSVSSRIVNQRSKQGLDDHKNMFVPNTPSFSVGYRLPVDKVDRFNIMMVTGVTHTPVMAMIIDSLSELAREFPKLKLSIIGTGPYEEDLKREVKNSVLRGKVEFLGQLTHESLLKKLPKAGVGLAIYTADYSWISFGDSMKAREYLLSGLPVIISDVVSTADDIARYKAGIVIKPNQIELIQAARKILKDEKLWINLRENAIKMARDFDMDKILDKALTELK